jgi:hypothetical protein
MVAAIRDRRISVMLMARRTSEKKFPFENLWHSERA